MIYFQFLATVFMIVMNTIAIVLPLNGMSTKELSDIYTTLITPAGFTFSIWSLIYLALITISLAVLFKKITLPKITLSRYVVSCLCNGLWIVVWHYQNLHGAMLLMLGLLLSLIMIDRTMKGQEQRFKWYQYVRAGFLLYLGWIVVASFLNTLIYLKYQLGLIGSYEPVVAIIALCIVALINISVINKERNVTTAMVFIWAMYGITQVMGTDGSPVWWTAHVLGLVMVGVVWWRGRKWVR